MSEHEIEPDQPYVVDALRPEDAEGVTRLFRAVYGEGYPIRTYVEPDLLIEENRALRTISTVARTEKGDIVGHNAIFHSAPSETIFESGSGVVHRHYRGGHIFRDLILHGQERAAGELNAEAIWGEPVLNHPFSQKCTASLGWMTFAVEVDLMPAAAYVKEKSAEGRVSTIMDFYSLNPRPHEVYLPAAYEAPLKELYARWPAPRTLSRSEAGPDPAASGLIQPQVFSFAQVARLAVHRIGGDFETAFDGTEREVLEQGAEVLQAWLPLADPAAGWAADRLRGRGYFFGGLLPCWFGGDGMLMQRTLQPPHWDTMTIVYDEARQVVEMARRDWEEVQAL